MERDDLFVEEGAPCREDRDTCPSRGYSLPLRNAPGSLLVRSFVGLRATRWISEAAREESRTKRDDVFLPGESPRLDQRRRTLISISRSDSA